MRLLGALEARGHRAPCGRKTAWGLCALFSLLLAPPVLAKGTPAGTQIRAWAQVSYEDANALSYTVASDTVLVVVGQVAGTDLEPPRSSITDPGTTVILDHTLANVGNGPDSFAVFAASRTGWPVRVYLDGNRNGFDASDPEVAGLLALAADDTAMLLVAVDVPGLASLRGTQDTVDVQAASVFDGSAMDLLQDVVEIRDIGILINLTKSVDRASATVGDVLTYQVAYSASGPNSAANFEIRDPLPPGTSYLAGTLRLNGVPLTDAQGDDAGYSDATTNSVVFQVGDIAGGQSGIASFQVRVQSLQPGNAVNSASGSYETFAGTDSIVSNVISTPLIAPEFSLEKTLVGPTIARIGDQIRYTVRYGNTSTVMARDVVVSDTLPSSFEFVSAQPAATVSDSVVTWSLGDLPPGDSALIDLSVRVSSAVRDTQQVSNVVLLTASNAPNAESAQSEPVQLIGVEPDQLSLDKTADVLEVGLGETAPYTLTLENTGLAPLSALRIHDRLPDGGRFARGSLIGADSVRAAGRDLTIFLAGPLAPGATHSVHYAVAIVSADQQTLANTAYATAEAGLVRSQDVTAWVRVRSNWPMETRAVIGKVWVDADGDGVQEPGERGVENVDIWTEDGEVASSDSEGKFSYRNIRPGRHAYRVDPTTVPMGYRLISDAPGGDLLIKDSDGWTTPRVNFRLLPREARLRQVRLPVRWSFQARPLRGPDLRQICGEAMAEEARTLFFQTNSALPQIDTVFIRRVAEALAEGPECWLEVSGHADPRPVHGGPYRDNWELSRARAEMVARTLIELGLKSPKVIVRGYGDSRPMSTGDDSASLQLNRRVELRLVAPPYWSQGPAVVEYEAVIANDYDIPLSGLNLRFLPAVDSAATVLDSGRVALAVHPVPLPTIAPHSRLTVRAWTRAGLDSARAFLETSDRSANEGLVAVVHNPLAPVNAVSEALVPSERLPNAASVPSGAAVEVVLEPHGAGWPEVAYALPEGWKVVSGSVSVSGRAAPDPEPRRDRSGTPWLFWRFGQAAAGPIVLHLAPATQPEQADVIRVTPLRSDEERQAERRRGFVAGPAVEVFEPRDGTVLPSDRVYVGVRGEAGAPVALFDGDSLIAEATLRVDGVHDFIAIPLSRGPHRLRVRMKNSWQQERWDSLTVHVTGAPAEFVLPDERISLVADGLRVQTVTVRVLDRWGVPVVRPVYVTASAEGAEPLGKDADPSSAGLQLRSDAAGRLKVSLRPGRDVGKGKLILRAGGAKREVELELRPAIRPLMVTGVARLGVGAAPDAFGSITARGRLDERTSVTLSYDSRRLDAGRDFFGRGYDPLEEAQYPLLGDASETRSLSASDNVFSARLERGFDWFALGDITTSDFTRGLTLTRYERALPGAAARVSTGPVVWKGFGSSTTQSLRQLQVRGAGVSGPYELGSSIRPGTEQIVIETRAKENAGRVISSQSLARYVDYQIDYANGTLLFKRPIPAADVYENPVFIVVTYEAESGGERQAVWGVRASADAHSLIESPAIDSLRVGATYISDGQSDRRQRLAGADLRVVGYGALDLGAELSYSESPDSSGFATAIDGSVQLFDGDVNVAAGWMRVGAGYHNASNLNLRSGTEEVRASGGVRIGSGEVRVEHERQTFSSEDVRRRRTSAGIVQALGRGLELDAAVASDRFVSGSAVDESQAGELKLSWAPTDRFKLWTAARRQFSYSGNVVLPDFFGGGAAFQLTPNVSLETEHRVVQPRDDSMSYSISRLAIRTELGLGTQAWGSYQVAGGVSGSQNAAILGLNNRLRFGDWSFNTLFERRFGLNSAAAADPVRALPFLRNEEDYWSAGLGLEFLPGEAPYRMSARGEYRDGDFRSTRLFTLAGDISFNRSLALLSRSEYLWADQTLASGSAVSERKSTLWGLAFRPVGGDALNVLTKFEWLQESDPIGGGVLGANGDERRVIGALEAIWAPFRRGELAGRYAMRRTDGERQLENQQIQGLTSWADYVGGRFDVKLRTWLTLRGESRLLIERMSDSRRWDAAPSLAFTPVNGFEAQLGYRFGDLRDPDFAVNGGPGLFAVFGVRITEQVHPTSADFWRSRIGRE